MYKYLTEGGATPAISHVIGDRNVRPKLKFYLFPLTRPTLKKALLKKIISIFTQDFFLTFKNCPM